MTRLMNFTANRNQVLVLFNLLVGATFAVLTVQYGLPTLPAAGDMAMAQTIGVVGLVAVVMPVVVLLEMMCFSAIRKSAQLVSAKRAK